MNITKRGPVHLTSGLKPDNVAEAIAQVRPFGLDICSGLRTDGHLDEEKVCRFFTNIQGRTNDAAAPWTAAPSAALRTSVLR